MRMFLRGSPVYGETIDTKLTTKPCGNVPLDPLTGTTIAETSGGDVLLR